MARQPPLGRSLALLLVGFLCLTSAAEETEPSSGRFQKVEASEASGNFSIHAEQNTGSLDPLASSLHCNNITGQCIPCTPEQQENEPACRATGYHQEITCIESFGGHSLSSNAGAANRTRRPLRAPQNVSTDNILEGAPLKDQREADRNATEGEAEAGSADYTSAEDASRKKRADSRQLLKDSAPGGRRSRAGLRQKDPAAGDDAADSEPSPEQQSFRKYVTFESCSPWEEETLSVFGFEAIMLSLLVVCSPIVYQRKRKATGAVAMTRVPSGSHGSRV